MKQIIYKGTLYDISSFLPHHPGGQQIIEQYLTINNNITEVFKSLHSREAENKLLTMDVVGKNERTKPEKQYMKIEEKINRLYQPNIPCQLFLILAITSLHILTILMVGQLATIFFMTGLQIMTSWVCHSQLHSHSSLLQITGKISGALVLGLSRKWWVRKHSAHHVFTNNQSLDKDIDHNYRTTYFPFLLWKWRIESLWTALKTFQKLELFLICLGYYITKEKWFQFAVAQLIASIFLSTIVFGNHERQIKYKAPYLDPFLTHQIATTTDYRPSIELDMLLGGFQHHTEHHLFPQIPFYKLKEAKTMIAEELQNINKVIKESPIL